MNEKSAFRFRPFISVLTTFSFLIIAVTGAVLYITPPGRVANWTNWTFWGLGKHQWGALHICFSAIFLLCCLVHIWLNRKPLFRYFVRDAASAKSFRFEWVAALLLCVLVFWGSLKPFVPFSSLLDWNEQIKFSWEQPKQQAPVPHAELLTIEELAAKADVEMEMILQNLRSHTIEASAADVFGDLAQLHNISPNALYQMAVTPSPTPSAHGNHQQGGGFGQQTLEAACLEMQLDVQKAIESLKDKGIQASADQTIRQIADTNGIHPSEIRQHLQ